MAKSVELNVDTKSKEFMFNLGQLFVKGEKIKIVNSEEVDKRIVEENKQGFAKSFNMMIKYWQDNNLTPNVMEQVVQKNKVFLICPVRNATKEDKEYLTSTINRLENSGYEVHYPARDTNQNPIVNGVNTGGYNICLENAKAIASSNTVAIVYKKDSVGSVFDIGVASYLAKLNKDMKIILINDIELKKDDFIDNKICELIG